MALWPLAFDRGGTIYLDRAAKSELETVAAPPTLIHPMRNEPGQEEGGGELHAYRTAGGDHSDPCMALHCRIHGDRSGGLVEGGH
jgi:hypothetical protein